MHVLGAEGGKIKDKIVKILTILLLVLLVISFFIISFNEVKGYSNNLENWNEFRGNNRNTGYSETDTPVNEYQKKWSFKTDRGIFSSPVLDENGTIYIGSNDDVLYALNKDDELKWYFDTSDDEKPTDTVDSGDNIMSTPLIHGENIIVGSHNGNLYSLRKDGSVRWSLDLNESIFSSPTGYKNSIYVAAGSQFYSISSYGDINWIYTIDEDKVISSSPAVDENGSIYFGCDDKNIYALDNEGNLKWNYTTEGSIFASPSISEDDKIYVGSKDSNLYALNLNGELLWKFDTSGDILSSAPIDKEDNIYFGSYDGYMYSVSKYGELNWKYDSKYQILSSPAISENGFLFFGSKNSIYALNISSGNSLWNYTTGGPVDSSPAIGNDGTLYVGSSDSKIYAFGETSETQDEVGIPGFTTPILIISITIAMIYRKRR